MIKKNKSWSGSLIDSNPIIILDNIENIKWIALRNFKIENAINCYLKKNAKIGQPN